MCQFTCTLWNFWKNYLYIIFLKNAYSAFFSILKRSYFWKMRGYPQFSFWISIAPDMIYLSHIVIIWEKYFPLVGNVLKLKRKSFNFLKRQQRAWNSAYERKRIFLITFPGALFITTVWVRPRSTCPGLALFLSCANFPSFEFM